MKTVFIVSHIECETSGIFAGELQKAGICIRVLGGSQGAPIPKDMQEAQGLIVMGGPMGVYEADRYPFLRDEMRLIEQAIQAGKPVLGVCLGSQLLAAALGAQISKGAQKEIGWFPVRLSESAASDPLLKGIPETFTPLHWHGDRFNLPEGAVMLALSQITPLQAFRYGKNAYGFLFHMEVTHAMLQEWVKTFSDELKTEKIAPASILAETQIYLPPLQSIGQLVFRRWVTLVSN